MTDASVTINNLNQNQGAFNEVERKALFIGVGGKNNNQLQTLNTQSDLADLLGVNSNELKTVVTAAKANGGQNWMAYTIGLDNADDWKAQLAAHIANVDPEFVVLCTPQPDQAALQVVKTEMEALLTVHAKRCQALVAVAGIDGTATSGQTWADYQAATLALENGLEASRLTLVPQLHKNTDLGVLAGRLCRHEVSVADSPQRVRTGSIFGLGAAPTDKDGNALTDAVLANLRQNRFNCIKRYTEYDGTYWGNWNTLAAEASDFQNGEWLRLADKAARRVRVLAIAMIDDRKINSSKASRDYTKRYLMRPLVEMSRAAIVNGVPFPGEIEPPQDSDIVINWISKTEVEIFITITPLESPKKITANILLDLSAPE